MMHLRFPAAVIGLSLALPFGPPELARHVLFGQTPSSLQVSSWSPTWSPTAEAFLGGQIATLNGTTYMVRSGGCGSSNCSKDLYWSKLTSTGWTPGVQIPNQRSAYKVSLAAFNGFLYMVHSGYSDEEQVWISKFDPDTETWSPNYMLSYRSYAGPPAIAVFDNRLHFVGTTREAPDENTPPYQMWTATMTAGETFTGAGPMGGWRMLGRHTSASRPSLAVYDNKLYVVHRAGETGEIQYSYRQLASVWSQPKYLRSGPLNAPVGPRFRSLEPVIASVEGYLHLLFRTPESAYVWWSYFDTCTWAAPVSLGTRQTTTGPSLTQGGYGLLLATTYDPHDPGGFARFIAVMHFVAPSAPITPPKGCSVATQ